MKKWMSVLLPVLMISLIVALFWQFGWISTIKQVVTMAGIMIALVVLDPLIDWAAARCNWSLRNAVIAKQVLNMVLLVLMILFL